MRPRWGLIFRSLLLGSCVASSALADGYDAAVTRAAAARDRALETHNARDWQEALELFAVALEFNSTKEAAFEFAEAALELDYRGEAYDAYASAVALGLSGKAEERARAFLDAHTHTLGRLALRGPAGARVYVDERKRAVLPLSSPLAVTPGVHHLHVDATNHRPLERDVLIAADETTTLEVTLLPLAEAPGRAAGRSPGSAAKGAEKNPESDVRGWAMPALVGGGGLTLAGVATVIVTTLSLADKRSELEDECAVLRGDECASTTAPHVSRAQSLGNDILALKGVRGIGVGAVVLGAAAVTFSVVSIASSHGASPRHTARLQASGSSLGMTWQSEY